MNISAMRDLKNKIDELGREQPWNHCINLPFELRTTQEKQISQGKNLIKWDRIKNYIKEIDVKGKRVLDVGCNEGYFSLMLKEFGAKEVIGIDADRIRLKKANFVLNVLGCQGIRYEEIDIFSESLFQLGKFDFTLCMGILHRVPNPYALLDRIARISDILLLEWKSLNEGSFNLPIMKYCGGVTKDSNPYGKLYWVPSITCVIGILESLGFVNNLIDDNSTWRRSIIISSRSKYAIFNKSNTMRTSKFSVLNKEGRNYIRSVLTIVNDKKLKWF